MLHRDLFPPGEGSLGFDTFFAYLKIIEEEVQKFAFSDSPCIGSLSKYNYYEVLKNKFLQKLPVDPETVLKEVAQLAKGLPIWNNPGTMLNVIPPANLAASAASSFTDMLNVNFSQDHYAGNLMLAELEVIKYISDIVEWDWQKSGGIFTFGGKGTSLYALKCAINRAYPQGKMHGYYGQKMFFIDSIKGHPCHAEVAEWLGLGTDSCVRIGCTDDGKIKVDQARNAIDHYIKDGYLFLGFMLCGGSTVEFEVDNIIKIKLLAKKIQEEYTLSYSPWIHVDSVVGWAWLFFNGYDFGKNELAMSPVVLKHIKSMNQDISGLIDADSFGVDFHKTGYCPYISSLFMARSREELCKVGGNSPKYLDLKQLEHGNYAPFEYSLELTRSARGAISALVSLKTMGTEGYRKLIVNLVHSVADLRNKLSKLPFLELLNPNARGLATLFVLKPEIYYGKNLDELLKLPFEETEYLKKYNVKFGYFVEHMIENGLSKINFTATDMFAVNNTNVYLGMMKMYPMSAESTTMTNDRVIDELVRLKKMFDSEKDTLAIPENRKMDMVYRKNGS